MDEQFPEGDIGDYRDALNLIAQQARAWVADAPPEPSAIDYGGLNDAPGFTSFPENQDVVSPPRREVKWLQFQTNVIRESGTTGDDIYVHPGFVFGSMCEATDQQYPDNEYGAFPIQYGDPLEDVDWDTRLPYEEGMVYAKITLKLRMCADVVGTDGFPISNFDIDTAELYHDVDENLPDERTDDGDHIIYVKIAKIADNVVEKQYQEGPIWINLNRSTPACASSSSSSSSSDSSSDSSASSGSSSAGDSGDSKSTAIVPVPDWFHELTPGWEHKPGDGFAALYIKESPEIKFDDDFTVPVHNQVTKVRLDPRFMAVCEPGSVRVVVSGDSGWAAGRVDGPNVVITCSRELLERPRFVTVYVVGTRRGFAGKRFEPRTREQFISNEAFINSAYSA